MAEKIYHCKSCNDGKEYTLSTVRSHYWEAHKPTYRKTLARLSEGRQAAQAAARRARKTTKALVRTSKRKDALVNLQRNNQVVLKADGTPDLRYIAVPRNGTRNATTRHFRGIPKHEMTVPELCAHIEKTRDLMSAILDTINGILAQHEGGSR